MIAIEIQNLFRYLVLRSAGWRRQKSVVTGNGFNESILPTVLPMSVNTASTARTVNTVTVFTGFTDFTEFTEVGFTVISRIFDRDFSLK